MDLNGKLPAVTGPAMADPSEYQGLADALQYLTVTWPDLSYAIQQACLHMHDLCECHIALIKRILPYVCGTMTLGLHLCASSSTSLTVYTDADWAGCPNTQ
jgi:hypothetical protein